MKLNARKKTKNERNANLVSDASRSIRHPEMFRFLETKSETTPDEEDDTDAEDTKATHAEDEL